MTRAPSSSPATSEPRIAGSSGICGYWPSRTRTSAKLIPTARTSTTAWPSATSGSGTSSTTSCSGPPTPFNTAALTYLGRRSHRRRARGAQDSTRGTDKSRAGSFLPRAASAFGGARLRRVGAEGVQGREGLLSTAGELWFALLDESGDALGAVLRLEAAAESVRLAAQALLEREVAGRAGELAQDPDRHRRA